MSACDVCGVRTLKTREPLAKKCRSCGKSLCHAHTHFYVDAQNAAITNAAPPTCADCAGMTTTRCVACGRIVEHRDPVQGHAIMLSHVAYAHGSAVSE